MDVRCPKCGEPWDIDTFHDAADEQDSTFDDVRRRFFADGCTAIGWGACNPNPDRKAALVSATLAEILGDDIDGIAAELEDAEFFGLL